MDKNDIHELLRRRKSPRAFSKEIMAKKDLMRLFEAARWAASSSNEQPWRFIFATKNEPENFEALVECLNPGNKIWASQAPVLVITIAKIFFNSNKAFNRHAWHDVGLATGNFMFQAMSMDLYVHPMAGFDHELAREKFNIPEGYEPATMMAVGYLGNADQLPEKLRERELAPRTRLPLDELVFSGHWVSKKTQDF